MSDDSRENPNFNHVYVRDRASVVTCGILAIVRDALSDPELRSRIAQTLRFEITDLERQVLSENWPNNGD